ncbi:methyl-accepting chemotaxis protein [Natrinema sp. HArc-T2]|uniref:methyl-accepting chemotaxis protein n=1 Tax=Natrinema sp. HArc-T2 TaxID=3242701 RepID=UPI00359EE629
MVAVSILVLGLIAAGALVMFGSILYTRRLFLQLNEASYRRRWRGLLALMVLFLLGYVAALWIAVSGHELLFQLLTGFVFLFGAVFVLLVVNVGLLTVNDLQNKNESLQTKMDEVEQARQEAVTLREETTQLNEHLERKADEYATVMQACAAGDLTQRMDPDSENEAMAEIAREFNDMLAKLESTTEDLTSFAQNVATASESVTASSEEVHSASEQVSTSIQEIADGADRQHEYLRSVTQELDSLSTTTEEIAVSSSEVADIAERTVDTGQDGQESARAAIAAMNEIETEASAAVTEIHRLEAEVQQIDELLNTIAEIARQTNMLALNANIEVSRSTDAGSGGDGFSAVATEVKALSEDVAEAAEEAEARLEAIRDRTEESAAEVERTNAGIQDASEQVQEAVDALVQITDLAQETNVGVQEISAASEAQAASTQEVVAMVDDVASISKETTAGAESVAAAAEEQTTALTEVSTSAERLSNQASRLSRALRYFETDAATTRTSPTND